MRGRRRLTQPPPAARAVAADLVRFRPAIPDASSAAFTSALAGLAPPPGPVLLAVSGGPDSMAMLLLAAAAALPCRVATVDHGLRAGADAEAGLVATLCEALGLRHDILIPDPPLAAGGSVQARARTVRYTLLSAHARATGCVALLTAHHQDDQAETFLMRAARGSGVDGLAGVRARGDWQGMPVLRPLLGWPRAALAALIAAAGIVAVDDPANRDPAHDRTRIRALLAETSDLTPRGLALSAATLADAAEALDWATARAWAERVRETPDQVTLDVAGVPREIARRLLVAALGRFAAYPPGPQTARLLARLAAGGGGTLGEARVTAAGTLWTVRRAPPRRFRGDRLSR